MRVLEHLCRNEVALLATELAPPLPYRYLVVARTGRRDKSCSLKPVRRGCHCVSSQSFPKHRKISASQRNGAKAPARSDLRLAVHNAGRTAAQSEGPRARTLAGNRSCSSVLRLLPSPQRARTDKPFPLPRACQTQTPHPLQSSVRCSVSLHQLSSGRTNSRAPKTANPEAAIPAK